ncbi:unnamed protein product, partial [Polarella glacialis]
MLATNIGALTTRGQLIRMVLFPASVKFKYNDQLPVVYGIMSVYAAILVFVLLFATDLGSAVATYLAVLCTVAMTLNPRLPVSMVMGQSVSAGRLEDPNGPYQIKCLQPGRIPIAGKISTMVFDKTGTITKGGMDFASVIAVVSGAFLSRVDFDHSDPECQANRDKVMDQQLIPTFLCRALVSCHTVKKLKTGSLVGNQVECAMVRTCGWSLGHRQIISPRGEILTVVRELEFDHHRMTSGAVVRDETGKVQVFIKGSYEKVLEIALPQSVPSNYDHVTQKCAKENFYTLGISTKELPSQMTDQQLADLPRRQLEDGVSVCGLLLFRNEMKADSPLAMEMLKKGSIRSVICTGDNALTGIAIGRQCGIVTSGLCLKGNIEGGRLVWKDPDNESLGYVTPGSPDPKCQLAVTCSAWRFLHLQDHVYLQTIWPRLVVFARMKPDDKINVVRYLQSEEALGSNLPYPYSKSGVVVSIAQYQKSSTPFSQHATAMAAPATPQETSVFMQLGAAITCLTDKIDKMTVSTQDTTSAIRKIEANQGGGPPDSWWTDKFGNTPLTVSRSEPQYCFFTVCRRSERRCCIFTVRRSRSHIFGEPSGPRKPQQRTKQKPQANPSHPKLPMMQKPRRQQKQKPSRQQRSSYEQEGDISLTTVPDLIREGRACLATNLATFQYFMVYAFTLTTIRTSFLVMAALSFGEWVWVTMDLGIGSKAQPELTRFRPTATLLGARTISAILFPYFSGLILLVVSIFLLRWSVGGTGGCFLGPQLKYWQNSTMSYWTPPDASEPWWLPSPDNSCLPPQRTLDEIPEKSTVISTGKGFKV